MTTVKLIFDNRALAFHGHLWKLLIDCRTKDRKQKLKPKHGSSFLKKRQRDAQEYHEMLTERETTENQKPTIICHFCKSGSVLCSHQ